MSERLHVGEPARLLEFLRRGLPTWKKKTLEQRLRAGCVSVNGTTVRRNDLVAPGDEVQVAAPGQAEPPRPPVPILFRDETLVAIDKPAGLVSVSTEREHDYTALALVREWLSRPGRPADLWPVHRLDRETSGVLLFARTRVARDALQADWSRSHKRYLAVVAGHPEFERGVIDQPLFEDRNLNVRVGQRPNARSARTRYALERVAGEHALLTVELDTGRRHQIRAHLAWLGLPVVGDPRYGPPGPRMGLHAHELVVHHPADDRELVLSAPPPRAFLALLAE